MRSLSILCFIFVFKLCFEIVFGKALCLEPFAKKLVNLIEAVQRRFTKRIPCLSSLSYYERLAIIDLDSHELSHLRTDLILYYKIINNLTPLPCAHYFQFYYPSVSSRTSQWPCKIIFVLQQIYCLLEFSASFCSFCLFST